MLDTSGGEARADEVLAALAALPVGSRDSARLLEDMTAWVATHRADDDSQGMSVV